MAVHPAMVGTPLRRRGALLMRVGTMSETGASRLRRGSVAGMLGGRRRGAMRVGMAGRESAQHNQSGLIVADYWQRYEQPGDEQRAQLLGDYGYHGRPRPARLMRTAHPFHSIGVGRPGPWLALRPLP